MYFWQPFHKKIRSTKTGSMSPQSFQHRPSADLVQTLKKKANDLYLYEEQIQFFLRHRSVSHLLLCPRNKLLSVDCGICPVMDYEIRLGLSPLNPTERLHYTSDILSNSKSSAGCKVLVVIKAPPLYSLHSCTNTHIHTQFSCRPNKIVGNSL